MLTNIKESEDEVSFYNYNKGIDYGYKQYRLKFRKCFICHRRGYKLKKVWKIGQNKYINHADRYYFHIDCIYDVLGEPEKYSLEVLDMALKVQELISYIDSMLAEYRTQTETRCLKLLKNAHEVYGQLKNTSR